jgi:hypothetical protein
MPSFAIHLEGMPDSVFSSKIYFPWLAGGATAQEMSKLNSPNAVQHRQNSFRLLSSFPFGLTERQVQVTLRREALVYPCLDPQPGFRRLYDRIKEKSPRTSADEATISTGSVRTTRAKAHGTWTGK